LEQLPEKLRQEAQTLIEEQKKAIDELKVLPEIMQYYVAMGFNVPCRVSYGLPAAVYVTELRSGKMVHPTLRKIAFLMKDALQKEFPNLILHCDLEATNWDISRGSQDIVDKKI
jgi:hypothetical protein